MASSGSAPSDVKKDSNPKMNKEEVNKERDVSASLENEELKKQEVNKDKDASAGLEQIDQEEVSSVKKKRKRDEDASGSEMNKEEVNKEKHVSASLENEKLKKQEVNKDKDASAGLEQIEEEVKEKDACDSEMSKEELENYEDHKEAWWIQDQERKEEEEEENKYRQRLKKERLAKRRRNVEKYKASASAWNWEQSYNKALQYVAWENEWLDSQKARIDGLKQLRWVDPEKLTKEDLRDIKLWDRKNYTIRLRAKKPEQLELDILERTCRGLDRWEAAKDRWEASHRDVTAGLNLEAVTTSSDDDKDEYSVW